MMDEKQFFQIPGRDPVGGGALHISELASDDSGVTIRGRFEIPRYAKLDAEQTNFLEIFLRCRGNLTAVEKEMSMSYPTVRARLDQMLHALELSPVPETSKKDLETKRQVLDQLERGEISAEEAKARIKELAS